MINYFNTFINPPKAALATAPAAPLPVPVGVGLDVLVLCTIACPLTGANNTFPEPL